MYSGNKVVSKTNVHNLICNKCAVVGLMSTLAVYLSVFPAACLVARQVPSLQFSSCDEWFSEAIAVLVIRLKGEHKRIAKQVHEGSGHF